MTTGREVFDAIRERDIELLQSLSAQGVFTLPANPEFLNFALACAVDEGEVAIAALLLEHGADPNDAHLLPDGSLTEVPLVTAIARKDPTMVRLLLSRGADANTRMEDGDTLLHIAVRTAVLDDNKAMDRLSRGIEIIRSLLQAGANPATANTRGVDPLHLAECDGNQKVIELLRGEITERERLRVA